MSSRVTSSFSTKRERAVFQVLGIKLSDVIYYSWTRSPEVKTGFIFKHIVLLCQSLFLIVPFVPSVFDRYYHPPTLANGSYDHSPQSKLLLTGNKSEAAGGLALGMLPESLIHCTRERPLLCLLLMLGTLWMGYTLYQFKRR